MNCNAFMSQVLALSDSSLCPFFVPVPVFTSGWFWGCLPFPLLFLSLFLYDFGGPSLRLPYSLVYPLPYCLVGTHFLRQCAVTTQLSWLSNHSHIILQIDLLNVEGDNLQKWNALYTGMYGGPCLFSWTVLNLSHSAGECFYRKGGILFCLRSPAFHSFHWAPFVWCDLISCCYDKSVWQKTE